MKLILSFAFISLCAFSNLVFAYQKGDYLFKIGVVTVEPDGDGALDGALQVDSNSQLGLTLTYMLSDNLGLNVLAATPFTHDITLGGTKIAETSHLPPTVTLQYHFNTSGYLIPYIGAGINYTAFFDEKSSLGDLSLDSSVGLALEAGINGNINEKWGWNASVWYADIDTDATLDGAALDTVEIDPWVYLLAAVYKS